jgi:hypothetical protein
MMQFSIINYDEFINVVRDYGDDEIVHGERISPSI